MLIFNTIISLMAYGLYFLYLWVCIFLWLQAEVAHAFFVMKKISNKFLEEFMKTCQIQSIVRLYDSNILAMHT